jgi:hypothetical protein
MSGSAASRLQEAGHGGDAVEHAFVHADVDDLGAVLDLLAGDGQGLLVVAGEDELRELGRTRDVGAFADVDEVRWPRPATGRFGIGGIPCPAAGGARRAKASRPLSRDGLDDRQAAGQSRTASAMARMWAGVVPQQPPTMLSQPPAAHSASCGARLAGVSGKPVSDKRIGQAGVGIEAGVGGARSNQTPRRTAASPSGPSAQFNPMVSGLAWHRVPERLDRLPGQRTTRAVGDGARNHHRNALAPGR